MTRTELVYATGYNSRDAAAEAIDDLFNDGEIDHMDRPRAYSYTARNGQRRWGIKLDR